MLFRSRRDGARTKGDLGGWLESLGERLKYLGDVIKGHSTKGKNSKQGEKQMVMKENVIIAHYVTLQ